MTYQRKENQFRIEQDSYVFIGNRNDPYGFWTISGKNGKKSIEMKGEYTSCDDAILAVKKKLNDLNVSEEVII